MKIKLLILLILPLYLFSDKVVAKDYPNNRSPFNYKVYKLSYEEYINHYGTNDTTRAIINIFFDKQNNLSGGQMSFLPISAAVTVVIPPIGIGLMTISSPLFVSGLITQRKYSRKRLLKTLQNYQNQDFLSKRLKTKINRTIQAENKIQEEQLSEIQVAKLKSINHLKNN